MAAKTEFANSLKKTQNKNVVVPFRVTSAERSDLQSRAKAEGWTLSDYIRKALRLRALQKKKSPALAVHMSEVEKIRRDHAGVARNINQLVKLLHSRGQLSDHQIDELMGDVSTATKLVQEMDQKLFGDED